MSQRITVQGSDISISLLAWRKFRVPTPGYVEAVLAANRGLADLGSILPIGTQLLLPDRPPVPDAAPAITLWD